MKKKLVSCILVSLMLLSALMVGCHDRTPVDPVIDNAAELGRGIQVNPSGFHPQGVDSLTVNEGDTVRITIESILIDDPQYKFTFANSNMAQIVADAEDPETFYVIVQADSGASSVLTIDDLANNATRSLGFAVSKHWANEDYFRFIGTFEEHYYYISTQIRSWVDAWEFCKETGGYLAAINSAEENAFLAAGRGRGVDNVWIGLRFNPIGDVVNDEWTLDTWVNGDSLTYENFVAKPSKPDIFAEYYFHMVDTGKWENWHEISYPYFLEME